MITDRIGLAAAAVGYRSLTIVAGSFAVLLSSAAVQAQVPISDAARVGAGTAMTCILTTAGGVKCWGNNDQLSLGDGTNFDSPGATDVVGLTSGVTAIAVGAYHACALTIAGAVKCWGSNQNGGLGGGSGESQSSPVAVQGLDAGVTAIGAGAFHTCAVAAAGALKCWGFNSYGQLGDGTTASSNAPVDVIGMGSGVASVAANYYDTCAVTTAGAVKCWGGNNLGQLGDGTTDDRSLPTAVVGLASGAVAVAAGGNHSCALLQTGALKCWGYNGNGQVGDGTQEVRLTPVDVNVGGTVVAVVTGNAHTCALLASGTPKCWGYNVLGQVGDGTTAARFAPTAVSGLAAGVTAIGVGEYVSCAIVAGAVKCWGSNQTQQLGDGATRSRLAPVGVVGLASGAVGIAAGGLYSCALTATGGAKCWGANNSGQLGDNSNTSHSAPVTPSGLDSGVSAVAAGYDFSCALTAAGGIKCWGENSLRQLGVAQGANNWVPNDVTGLTSGVGAISSGNAHSCALTGAGGVKCWGYNQSGTLGSGNDNQSDVPVDVIGLVSGAAAVAAGSYHTCAVLTTGAVKCWGSNGSGQLGDGSTSSSSSPVAVTGLDSGVIAIAAGNEHSCALSAGGIVKCWGANQSSQLGDGSGTRQLAPVAVKGLPSGVTAITAGDNHTCAIAGGAMLCWGGNREGRLGDGTTIDQPAPVAVLGLSSGVTAIDGGSNHTCAVVAGAARCWGADAYGQLGDGVVMSASTPVTALLAPPQVIEFYNTPLDNYFITANPAEAAAIGNGSAGPGWARTGNRFPSGGPIEVCRFYGSLSPGPNSHFYTADAAECASLKAIQASTPASEPRWNFESLDFLTDVPASGVCPARTIPVYRAYNNGFSRHVDSNHRITNNQASIQAQVALGWSNEGIVMCAPE